MNPIDTTTPIGVTLALLPEVVLSIAALGVLLVNAWRHETAGRRQAGRVAEPGRRRRRAARAALALGQRPGATPASRR